MSPQLLATGEPPPVRVINPAGRSPFLLVCDHAGRRVPQCLGDMGVSAADWDRHIAWDIGTAPLCDMLANALDAVCIAQTYSRLVIDCNRRPGHPASIPPVSDGTPVPANVGIPAWQATARVDEVFAPYHAAIAGEVDRRLAEGRACVFIAVHSFTPVMGGVARPWQAGVLHNRAPELSRALGRLLAASGLLVGDNEPYRMADDSDYTVPLHAESRGLPYVELEIRQDLIGDAAGQAEWSGLLARALPEAKKAVLF